MLSKIVYDVNGKKHKGSEKKRDKVYVLTK